MKRREHESDRRVASTLHRASKLPASRALEYLKQKDIYVPTDEESGHSESSFVMAKVTKAAILRDVKGLLEKALDEGLTFEQFKAQAKERLEPKGWWQERRVRQPDGTYAKVDLTKGSRLKTMFQTQMQEAMMAARHQAMLEVADKRPWWRYHSVIDKRTTHFCRRMHGTVIHYSDPIFKSIVPPNHYACRARLDALTDAYMEKHGLTPVTGAEVSHQLSADGTCDIHVPHSPWGDDYWTP